MSGGTDDAVLRELAPPPEVMKRIGPIFDVATYIRSAKANLASLEQNAYLRPTHSVLDVGCGFGRLAAPMTQFLSPKSKYLGLDVVKMQIEWCSENISKKYPNFEFKHLDVYNKAYNPKGKIQPIDVEFPAPAASFDVAILFSVFTHMLPNDIAAYLKKISACLKDGGVMVASFFLMNPMSSRYVAAGKGQFRFFRQNDYYVTQADMHEGAVAYEDEQVWAMLQAAELYRDKVIYGNWSGRLPASAGQDLVVCSKHARI